MQRCPSRTVAAVNNLETAVVSARGAARIGAGHPWVFRPDVVRGPKHDAGDGGPSLVRVRDGRGRRAGRRHLGRAPAAGAAHGRPGRPARAGRSDRAGRGAPRRRARPAAGAGPRPRRLSRRPRRERLPARADHRSLRRRGGHPDDLGRDERRARGDRGARARAARRARRRLPRRRLGARLRGAAALRGHRRGRRRHARRLPAGSATGWRPTSCATARPAASSTRPTTTRRSRRWRPPGARALDAFTHHGGFALALARGGGDVLAIDEDARRRRARAPRTRAATGSPTCASSAANAFDLLRAFEGRGERFDVVVLDPPALAKRGGPQGLATAARAYKELVLRGARLTRAGRPAGRLLLLGPRDARALGRDLRRRDRRRGPERARPRRAPAPAAITPSCSASPRPSHLKVWTFRML